MHDNNNAPRVLPSTPPLHSVLVLMMQRRGGGVVEDANEHRFFVPIWHTNKRYIETLFVYIVQVVENRLSERHGMAE